MDPLVFYMIFVFGTVFVINLIRLFMLSREKVSRIEIPGKVERIGYYLMSVLTFLMALMLIMSLFMRDMEMIIVTAVIVLIFATIAFFMRRKYRRYYRETEESFLLKGQHAIVRVDYENIVDWMPMSKQIGVRDKTQYEDRYICVNYSFSDPEILLTKLLEMTLSGKFDQTESDSSDYLDRKDELIQHLEKNGYGYLVEEALAK